MQDFSDIESVGSAVSFYNVASRGAGEQPRASAVIMLNGDAPVPVRVSLRKVLTRQANQ